MADARRPKRPPPPIPGWAWAFAAACLLSAIVTRIGAITGAVAGGSAGACLAAARNRHLPVPIRLLVCALVAAAAWGTNLAVVSTLALLNR